MRLPSPFVLLTAAALISGGAHAASPAGAPAPAIFAPGVIAGNADDGAAAFTPDGATVYFMRGTDSFTLMESHCVGGRWSTPRVAPFSGRWRDLDPAMAPDGSYLVFASNRPVAAGGAALDGYYDGKPQPRRGGKRYAQGHRRVVVRERCRASRQRWWK
ncbi:MULTISPECIES: PD40 domain-containing protein [Rhodanobacter]|uniref:PD40 domain-containing protein n=1 Tax=Rhodanobacter TaxID=75309 RepID=UPI000260EA5E|nr:MULTISPECIES: PD40 domain-containing protein [Rhodanobacter]EIM03188.1 WD40 domain-containing protein [Rhodanobacter denitrificans]KZC19149.1 hypothetical protein RHOFW104R3_32820 [Rhodanobacter denitrificans]UJJ51174.1 PD40 domain-containing protein [Rhodanobacter denitrificans]UJM90387.1 PD40 domain-containing protein [Rhodanobacter denitrificans]UJM93920.1 PD40 domain-containing protein [Rhodanobacter denitrificans]